MKHSHTPSRPMIWMVLATLALFIVAGAVAVAPKVSPLPPPQQSALATLPLAFVPNQGQMDAKIQLQVQARGGTLSFFQDEIRFTLDADTEVRLYWEGATSAPDVAGMNRLPGVANIMRGNDPARWQTDLPLYSGATYTRLYPGIDLHYDGKEGTLKGTYTVAPGADPAAIRWKFEGADTIAIDEASGDLQIALPDGQTMIEKAPVSWQIINGEQVFVPTRYQVEGQTSSFIFPDGYDPAYPLVIDPTLLYSSYIGGNSSDSTNGIALDGNGNIYLTGETYSTDFLGQSEPVAGSSDIFVAKLNATGTQLLYLAVIGTDSSEYARDIQVDNQGNAVVTLDTFSTVFPMVNPLWGTRDDPADTAILMKLNNNGQLGYSTYLPLRGLEATHNLALDAAGNPHVTGIFNGAQDPEGNWLGEQVALVKLSADGQSLLLGGHIGAPVRNSDERGNAITVDQNGLIYIVGTQGFGYGEDTFGTPNAHQPICGEVASGSSWCEQEGFLYVLNGDGSLSYASYHGGKAGDEPVAVATNGDGNVLIAGTTRSPDFPTVNALQPTCPLSQGTGDCDQSRGFISLIQIHPTHSTVRYSTYWGAPDVESGNAITALVMDEVGNAYVAGWTDGLQFPLKDPIQSTLNTSICNLGGSERYCYDGFISQFTPNGQLGFSTYFGATFDDLAYDLAVDETGTIFFVGQTEAADFPTTDTAIQPDNLIQDDGFLVKIGMGAVPPPTGTPTATVAPGGATPTPTPMATVTPIPNAKKNYLPLVGGRP